MNRFLFCASGLLALSLFFVPVGPVHAVTTHIDSMQRTALAVPEWDITFIYANLDTVVVEIKIVNPQYPLSDCYRLYPPSCSMQAMHWVITPCPLLFDGNTTWVENYCTGGTFDFSPPFADNFPIRVALRTGLTYTFSGWLTYYGRGPSPGEGCNPFANCIFRDEPAPAIYVAPTLATTPTTWGRIKSLYRSP